MDAENKKQMMLGLAGVASLTAATALYQYMKGDQNTSTIKEKSASETIKVVKEQSEKKKEFKINWTNLRDLADKYDVFLFDCDGVLWHGDAIMIGEAFRNIEWLESKGKQVFFVTNNASKSRKSMVKKMQTSVFNYKNAKENHMYPASTLAAQYVLQKYPNVKKVRYIGMEEMGEEIRSNGLETIGGTHGDQEWSDPKSPMKYEDIKDYKFDPEVGAVITGIDFAISYAKILLASCYLQKGAKWIVTNDDEFTMQSGFRAPGNGCIIAAIENGLKKADGDGLICEKVVTGKPNAEIIDLIRGQHNIPKDKLPRMIMFGDRPNTDIGLANNAGIDSVLVLTGVVTSEQEVHSWASRNDVFKPTYVMTSFGEDIKMTAAEKANL